MGSQKRVQAPSRNKRDFNWTEPGKYVIKGEELREEVKNERILQLEATIKSEEVCKLHYLTKVNRTRRTPLY
jgi:hypothetical protein